MEEKSTNRKRLNYRITVILQDEVITGKLSNQEVAVNKIIRLRDLYPEIFIGGALEKRGKKWEVIWTLKK